MSEIKNNDKLSESCKKDLTEKNDNKVCELKSSSNTNSLTQKEKITRRDFIVLTGASMAGVGLMCAAVPFVDSLNPSADVLAASSIEVELDKIQQGQTAVVNWRGKPVFIKHRTDAEIQEAESVKLSELVDPEQDNARVKPGYNKWLVVIGICTHLGCVPIDHKGDYGGWFCPCHGSHYDTSGRIRKGPAPQNLEIPPYQFITDHKIKIG